MQLSLAVFVAVTLGSVGLVAFFSGRLQPPGGSLSGVGVAAGAALAVVLVGYLLSRQHLSAVRSPQLGVAQGPVEIVSDALDDCRVRIGGTELRLPGADALPTFQPGAEYRVYYLAGPWRASSPGKLSPAERCPGSPARTPKPTRQSARRRAPRSLWSGAGT